MGWKWGIGFLLLVFSCAPIVPGATKRAFEKSHGGVKGVEWKKISDSIWKASYYIKEFNYISEYYNIMGHWRATEYKLSMDEIPQKPVSCLLIRFPNAQIIEVYKKVSDDGMQYIFEIEFEGRLLGVSISQYGNIQIIPENDQRFFHYYEVLND